MCRTRASQVIFVLTCSPTLASGKCRRGAFDGPHCSQRARHVRGELGMIQQVFEDLPPPDEWLAGDLDGQRRVVSDRLDASPDGSGDF